VKYEDGNIQAIEAKYKSKLKSEDISGLKSFATKFKTNKKLIISKDIDDTINDIEIKSFYALL
jgi:predicted AAA+ superfamily ATPase